MKRKVTIVFLCCISSFLNAQIGIGTTVPNGALDIVSTSQGLLIPRVSLTANNIMAPVTNPAGGTLVNGTIVYNTATNSSGLNKVTPGFYYWENTTWFRLESSIYSETVYGLFTSNTSQTITNSIGDKVNFGVTIATGGVPITYDPINKNFTLPAGKTYRIDFSVGWAQFVNGTFLRFALYDDSTNLKISSIAHCESVANSGAFMGAPNFTHFITVGSTPIVLSVRTIDGNTTNFKLGDTSSGTALPTIAIQSIN